MKLSVLIGTRNRVEPLRRCLESLRIQSLRPTEVLVLDDASDAVVADSLTGFPEVRILRAERPLGVAPGRNRLLREATGDLLVVLDDDAHLADPRALERVCAAVMLRPQIGIVAMRIVERVGERQRLLGPFSAHTRRTKPEVLESPCLVSYFLGCGHALRREVCERLGGYDERFVWGEEELDLSYRVIQAGYEIYYAPEVVVIHEPMPAVLRTTGRPQSELFYHVRNRITLAWKYLPVLYAVPYLSVWMSRHAGTAIRQGLLGDFVRGAFSGLRSVSSTNRRPLTPEARSYLKRNYGRLWF